MKTAQDIIAGRIVVTVGEADSVQVAAQYMSQHNIGALPVVTNNRLVGIVTERDILNKVVAPGNDIASVKVGEIMSRQLVIADADESCDSCTRKMKHANIRHLPVIEGDRLVGILSIRDLLIVDMNEKTEKIEFLEQYIVTVPPGMERKYK
jgi:CBS domain-containing protein